VSEDPGQRPVRVLSIDGGGIRGLIPAIVLAELEERSGTPAARLFDLVVGTSIGGILALGLTRPGRAGAPFYSAERLVHLLEEHGPTIFSLSLWERLERAGGLLDERYSARPLERVLERFFGEARLREAITDLVIPSYEIELPSPWFFRSRQARVDPEYDFPMRDVARAASAAPTYFEPHKLTTDDVMRYYALVDGGVFANNPTLCGYVEARTLYPGRGDFLVVSLGTGQRTRSLPYARAKNWGLVGWAKPILDVVFHGVSETVDYQMRVLCGAGAAGSPSYHRFQVALEQASNSLDDASPQNIRALRLEARRLIDRDSRRLDEVCRALTAGVRDEPPR